MKAATIIHVLKKTTKVKALNDFSPMAVMSVVMKMLQRLVLTYLKYVTNFSIDPSSSSTGKIDVLMMLLHLPCTWSLRTDILASCS